MKTVKGTKRSPAAPPTELVHGVMRVVSIGTVRPSSQFDLIVGSSPSYGAGRPRARSQVPAVQSRGIVQ